MEDIAPPVKSPLDTGVARPRAFSALVLLVCFHLAIAFAYFHPGAPFFLLLAIASSVAIVYGVWRGLKWGRIATICTAIFGFIVDLPRLDAAPRSMRLILLLRLLCAATLMVWLNRPAVTAYFKRST
jgi:hypothetical protein